MASWLVLDIWIWTTLGGFVAGIALTAAVFLFVLPRRRPSRVDRLVGDDPELKRLRNVIQKKIDERIRYHRRNAERP